MMVELRMAVNMKEGVIRSDVSCWALGEIGLRIVAIKAGRDGADGRIQRVEKNKKSKQRLDMASINENFRERKTSSPMNLQFTVHFQRNCLENSKARPI